MPLPDTEWDVGFDKRFVDAFEGLEGSGFQDRVQSTVEKIASNPLTGEAKTGVLKGTRTTHIEHLVIQWELDPEIHRRSDLESLDEVYFLNLTHHDDMEDVGRRGPVESGGLNFQVEFDKWEIGAVMNAIHRMDGTSEIEEQWEPGPPVVTGKIEEDSRDKILDIIPDSADVSFESDPPNLN